MTPERAEQLARDNGCTFTRVDTTTWCIQRDPTNYGFISRPALLDCTDEKFVAFYLPDARD